MTYENFTTFTEQDDTGDHIQEPSATHVDAKLYKNGNACLYKDYGANHFGSSWEHKIDIKLVSYATSFSNIIAMVGTDKGSQTYLMNNAKSALYIFLFYGSGVNKLAIREMYQGSVYESSAYAITTGTMYYLTLKRNGTSFTCKVYSDSARTNLLDTLSLTLNANHPSHQYYQPCAEIEYGSYNYWGDFDIDNLDFLQKEWFLGEAWLLINIYVKTIFAKPYGIYTTDIFPSFVFFMFVLSIVITFICVFPVYRRRGHKNV